MRKKTEDQYIESLINILKERMSNDYLPGNTKRDAHPKALGLLKATFKVSSNLPSDLKIGVFKSSKNYSSLIRISSSSAKIESDNVKDVRGFAIKLLNIPGEKVLQDEKNTQDFIFISNETFPFSNLQSFHDLVFAVSKGKIPIYLVKSIIKGNILSLFKLIGVAKNQTSPLDISYFSTTSYMFGDKVVRYCIEPTSKYKSKMPKELTPTYLSVNMQNHLNKNIATFDFKIQIQKDGMEDDPSVVWSKKKSPYIKIGEIVIDKQEFMNKKREDLAENLSFNPGHALLAHKPIGEFNRARIKIYENLSEYRHKRNGEKLIEPTSNDFNNI